MKFKKIFSLSIIALAITLILGNLCLAENNSKPLPKLLIFFSPSCHSCIEAKEKKIPLIEKEFIGRLAIEYRDVTDTRNYALLLTLKDQYEPEVKINLPLFFLEGKFLYSDNMLQENIRNLVGKVNKGMPSKETPQADLIAYFKGFTPLAIVSAGLIDGINPCAFTVIVFFISFLALQGYRKRELSAIGLAFILAVCLTYILVGLGLFAFFYEMKGFSLISKILNLGIGIFSIVLGLLAAYDFIIFKKTNKTEGLVLQLPQAVKNQIHKVIGMHYRKGRQEQQAERHMFGLIISAFVTGFLVSLLEAVCTGQTYLPTISFILKTTNLKLQALGYLLLYNFMFIVPLLIIFLLALFGVTSEEFSGFLKKHMLTIKVFMAILFIGLGIFLIWGM